MSNFLEAIVVNKFLEAIENFNKAIAYNDSGIAKFEMGKFAEAIENFNEAIGLNPNCAVAYNNREIVLTKLKEVENE